MIRYTLRTAGHADWDVLAEVWRLFFGDARRLDEPAALQAVTEAAAPLITDIQLESRLDGDTVSIAAGTGGHLNELRRDRCDRSERRRVMNRQLYFVLAELTGIRFPWGSLTGVRPTQMADYELGRTGSPAAAVAALRDDWFVSPAKAALAVEVNAAEQAILGALPADALAVYVGVPFCPSRCLYCSFTSRDAGRQPQLLASYAADLRTELLSAGQDPIAAYGRPVALYIGGGTPTTLADAAFADLLNTVLDYTGRELEITVEAGRPETITPGKLALLRAAGITRICLNPQTMKASTLPKLNRHHDTEDILRTFELARAFGMTDINMDLIAGLTEEAPADFLGSVDSLIALGPEKITLHALAKKAGSFMHDAAGKGGLYEPLPDWVAAYAEAGDRLRAAGYAPYYLYRQKYTHAGLENIGFAKPGHETVYNVAMMSDRVNVLGFGAGSSTKFIVGTKAHRLHNPKDVKLYGENAASLGAAKREEARRLGQYRER